MAESNISLRNVTKKDYRFLYSLNNHPSIRAVSNSTDEFSYDTHVSYWDKFEKSPECNAKIIIMDKIRVGCIRSCSSGISLSILPIFWGLGIGKNAIMMFAKKGDKAQIKPENMMSLFAFKSAGFKVHRIVMVKE